VKRKGMIPKAITNVEKESTEEKQDEKVYGTTRKK
jgi:hypothetical protein